MRRVLGVVLVTVGSAALVLAHASAASSAPTNAPSSLVGTADCGPDGTFDFVVNSGNTEANTWNPAFVTRSDGRTGLFIPASVDLTFTTPFGTFTEVSAKATAPGPVSCEISASPEPGFTLTGTVTGRIVLTG
jgi:hypothetical protein